MASTSIDRVFLELALLECRDLFLFEAIFRARKFVKTFLMCATEWNHNNDMYLESDNDVKQLSIPSLSCIMDTLDKQAEDIHSIFLGSETDGRITYKHSYGVFSELEKQIKSFKDKIIKVYFHLKWIRSLQSKSGMTYDELMELIDCILQDLAHLTTVHCYPPMFYTGARRLSAQATLGAQVQALEVKLTFLKSFIPFAKLRRTIDIPLLLLAHFKVVALNAARLSYMYSFWDENTWIAMEWYTLGFYSIICKKQKKTNPVDFHVYEIYMEVLRATRSSKSLDSPMMDKQILNNFNDSLMSCLWELLCYSSSLLDSIMKDQMQILYAGLRFLRRILRQHQEKMDEQNERIEALLSEAGIIICSPSLNRVKEGKISFLESTEALDCYDKLAKTNIHIKHFEDQISGSSTIESLPSSHGLIVQAALKPSSHMESKGKIPISHDVMVGLDDEAEKVIDRLISGPGHLEIVPIVGMAGLGKTTLAKKVYSDSSVVHNFHIRLWCTISQEFNMKNLLLQILCSDGKQSWNDEELKKLNEHELLHKLYQTLKTKRYLIVFDDVWYIKVWNELRCSFPDDKNRSRILFTSRFSNVVASEVQYGGKPHNLRPLSEKESFELLQRKVFGKEDCPQSLFAFAMEIAKKCRGLPLAVIVVAGVLAVIEHDIFVWEEFAKYFTLTTVSGADECKKSVELSYGYLPYPLKACLLYFAAFQEDEKIGAKKLMRLWIAEGLVTKIEGRRSEDIAEEYLMDLIGRNLVMVSESKSIGGVKTCYTHDLILEFCKKEAKVNNFLQVLRGYDELSTFIEPPNLLRLSIFSNGKDFTKSKLFCPHLGSLLFFNSHDLGYNESYLFNGSSIFCIYKHLKVLNLEGINLRLRALPTEVESLIHLRYLVLAAVGMRFIPLSIAKLSNLETFCLHSYVRVSLPDSIWNMKKLKHVQVWGGGVLDIPFSSNDDVVEILPTLPNLDTLSALGLDLDRKEDDILGRIPNVRRLKIFLRYERGGCCNMSGLECLESLTLYCSNSDYHLRWSDCIELSFPVNLKKLNIAGMSLSHSKMSLIEQLPNLEILKLGRNSLGQRWELIGGGFPKLRVLILTALDTLEWTGTDPDSDDYFPSLQRLRLCFMDLKMVPSCLGLRSTLETIELMGCGDGTKSLVREIEETRRYYYGDENLKIIFEKY